VVDRDLVPRGWVIGADHDLADAEDRFSVFSIQHKEISGLVAGVGYASTNPELQRRIKVMKYLLSGVAIVAALAIVAPASAQRTGPGSTAPSTTGPGVNPPGGPGPSSPLYNLPAGSPGIPGTPQSQYPGSPGAIAPVAVPGVTPGTTTSATPPEHRHARHMAHAKATRGGTQLTGDTANQLNAEELQRLQAGQYSNPPVPPGTMPPAR
jgi:hypothetical protein